MSIATLPAAPAKATGGPAKSDGRFRFSVEQFWDMNNRGFFDGKRVEFIGGEVIEMPSQGNKHLATIEEIQDILRRVFGHGYWVRAQGTLDLSPHGVPDPDIAVVRGDRLRPSPQNPTTALLIVEVGDSRLRYDQTVKASMYAAAGIPDYWIVNFPDRRLEIRRNPQPDSTQEFGFGYGSLTTLNLGETATPLAAPNGVVPVERLFFWSEPTPS